MEEVQGELAGEEDQGAFSCGGDSGRRLLARETGAHLGLRIFRTHSVRIQRERLCEDFCRVS